MERRGKGFISRTRQVRNERKGTEENVLNKSSDEDSVLKALTLPHGSTVRRKRSRGADFQTLFDSANDTDTTETVRPKKVSAFCKNRKNTKAHSKKDLSPSEEDSLRQALTGQRGSISVRRRSSRGADFQTLFDSANDTDTTETVRPKKVSAFCKYRKNTKAHSKKDLSPLEDDSLRQALTGQRDSISVRRRSSRGADFQTLFDSANDTDTTETVRPKKVSAFCKNRKNTKAHSKKDLSPSEENSLQQALTGQRGSISVRRRSSRGAYFQTLFNSTAGTDTTDTDSPKKVSAFRKTRKSTKLVSYNRFEGLFNSSGNTSPEKETCRAVDSDKPCSDQNASEKHCEQGQDNQTVGKSQSNIRPCEGETDLPSGNDSCSENEGKSQSSNGSLPDENASGNDESIETDLSSANDNCSENEEKSQSCNGSLRNKTASGNSKRIETDPPSANDNCSENEEKSQSCNGSLRNKTASGNSKRIETDPPSANDNCSKNEEKLQSCNGSLHNGTVSGNGERIETDLPSADDNCSKNKDRVIPSLNVCKDTEALLDNRSDRPGIDEVPIASESAHLTVSQEHFQNVSNRDISDIEKLDTSSSAPSAILHIESDFDSMASSSESDDESDAGEDENGNKSGSYRSISVNLRSQTLQNVSRKTTESLSRISQSKTSHSKSNLVIISNSFRKEISLSSSMAKRIVTVNESFDSMEMTTNSDFVEESISVNNPISVNEQNTEDLDGSDRETSQNDEKSASSDHNNSHYKQNTDVSLKSTSTTKQTDAQDNTAYNDCSNKDISPGMTSLPNTNLSEVHESPRRGSLRKSVLNDSQNRLGKENSQSSAFVEAGVHNISSSERLKLPTPRKRVLNNSRNMSHKADPNKRNTSLSDQPRSTSLRKRLLNDLQNKSNKEIQSPGADKSNINGSLTASNSDVAESRNRSEKRSKSRKIHNQPKSNDRKRNSNKIFEMPLSELRDNRKRTNTALSDCDLVNKVFTMPEPKKLNVTSNSENDSPVLSSEDESKNGQGKVRKNRRLKKPKPWISNHTYKFVIDKLEPKYGIKSRKRAEKFIEFLVDKVTIVGYLNEKEQYKKIVDELMTEMARLKLVETYYDFYIFVHIYLPHKFWMKSVPATTFFNREPLVDPLPPGKAFTSIL